MKARILIGMLMLVIVLGVVAAMAVPTQVAAQQESVWMVLESRIQLEPGARSMKLLMGPYVSMLTCQPLLQDVRTTGLWREYQLTRATCQSAVDVARMMLQP